MVAGAHVKWYTRKTTRPRARPNLSHPHFPPETEHRQFSECANRLSIYKQPTQTTRLLVRRPLITFLTTLTPTTTKSSISLVARAMAIFHIYIPQTTNCCYLRFLFLFWLLRWASEMIATERHVRRVRRSCLGRWRNTCHTRNVSFREYHDWLSSHCIIKIVIWQWTRFVRCQKGRRRPESVRCTRLISVVVLGFIYFLFRSWRNFASRSLTKFTASLLVKCGCERQNVPMLPCSMHDGVPRFS